MSIKTLIIFKLFITLRGFINASDLFNISRIISCIIMSVLYIKIILHLYFSLPFRGCPKEVVSINMDIPLFFRFLNVWPIISDKKRGLLFVYKHKPDGLVYMDRVVRCMNEKWRKIFILVSKIRTQFNLNVINIAQGVYSYTNLFGV
jgi:hypothetical protein